MSLLAIHKAPDIIQAGGSIHSAESLTNTREIRNQGSLAAQAARSSTVAQCALCGSLKFVDEVRKVLAIAIL